jgi:acetylornithine deacetylase/succinyl-diaminopimelate desuccinylase-like protein
MSPRENDRMTLQALAAQDPVTAHLFAQLPQAREWLFDYLRIPSVATDSAYAAAMQEARRFVKDRLAGMGLENVQELDGGGQPALYAEWCHAPGKPTIIIYGHYDVQPPDPLAQWRTPPFEPTVVDGCIYARGASDVKAATTIALDVVGGFLAVEGACPVNIKFFLEGEEEIGSPTLRTIIERYRSLLQADAVLSADGGRVSVDPPTLNVGARGNAAFEVTVRTARKDLHSGRYGGAVRNAVHVLTRMLASLHNDDGSVAVAGFYEGSRPLSAQDREDTAALHFCEEAFVGEVGGINWGEAGYTLRERVTLRPCIDVNGISGGYTGEGGKTIVPCEASAKVSLRVVPGQDSRVVLEHVIAHLRAVAPQGVQVSVAGISLGSPASSLDPEHLLYRCASAVLQRRTGQRPVPVRLGATVPITSVFKTDLGIDTLMFGHNLPDEDVHAPNEFFRLQSIEEGLIDWAGILRELGQHTV